MSIYQHPLDSVDHFIKVAGDIAKVRLLSEPQYKKEIAEDLYQICQELLVANGNLARWLNRFLLFDFSAPNAYGRFLDLDREYQDAKATSDLHEMKFSCGDIYLIYDQKIQGRMDELFVHDKAARVEAESAFIDLGHSDTSMVAFIHDQVVQKIDKFILEVKSDANNLNRAESRRLDFNVDSSELSERLVRFGNELSDLVLQYARLAGRSVTLMPVTLT